jgi:ADP-ribosylglycohydrolase
MFLGIAIGDALGKPIEMWKIDKIAKVHGRVTDYKSCEGHKFFDGHPVGSITDDTILSQAVAEALIKGEENLELHGAAHGEALNHAMGGWGGTTKDSLRRLQKGVPWSESGKTANPKRGTGNGVAMKVLPYGAYCAAMGKEPRSDFLEDLSLMTHYTKMGIASGFVMATAALHALSWEGTPTDTNIHVLVDRMLSAALDAEHANRKGNETEEKLSSAIEKLYDWKNLTPEKIVEEFGAGGCYIMWSVPFTLAFWMRNPASIETVYDLASAGGDTDSNCSMGAGLVGAVAGEGVFPQHLLEGLTVRGEMIDLADRFCDRFGIN